MAQIRNVRIMENQYADKRDPDKITSSNWINHSSAASRSNSPKYPRSNTSEYVLKPAGNKTSNAVQ